MDSDPAEETSPEIQASLMGAPLRSRGVPGGLQGVPLDPESNQAPKSDASEIATEAPSGAASLLGISPETLAAVGPPSPEVATPPDTEEVVAPVEVPPVIDIETPAAVEDLAAVEELPVVDAPLVIDADASPEAEASSVVEVEIPVVVEEPPVAEAETPPIVESPAVIEEAPPPPVVEDIVEATPEVIEEEPDNLDDPKPDGIGRVVLEWVVVLVGAVLMALVLRQFIFQAFWIPSESMETTLEIRDRVLVNRLSYQWGDVGRGDIVVFERKPEETGEIRDLIKRVIGLPGETVEGRDNTIYIDGSRLDESYIAAENMSFSDFGPVLVPEDELFVMGNNRDQSFDSRFFGTVNEDRVAGRAFVLFWPLDRVGAL